MPVASDAAALLIHARDAGEPLAALPEALRPIDTHAAYAIQAAVAAATGPIGGWKVGASGPDAAPNCAPMPAAGIIAGPGRLPRHAIGVEAEVAFRIGHAMPPREAPYDRAEVIAALTTAHPAIEWLASRFAEPASVDGLSLLADSLLHGGFVFGAGRADWAAIDFAAETVTQDVAGAGREGARIERVGNPAGDMIRLVQWLADEGAVWAGGLRVGQFVTCGSWTGKTAVRAGEAVTVRFASLGVVEATA